MNRNIGLIFGLLCAFPQLQAGTTPGYPGLWPTQRTTLGLDLGAFNINTYNGNLNVTVPLCIMPGRGLPLEGYLVYNLDHRQVTSPYGLGWSFSYNIRYQRHGNGDVTIVWGTGRQDRFMASGGGFTAPPGLYMTLTEPTPGLLELRHKQGCVFVFANSQGKLTSIVDPNGNQVVLTYNPHLLLQQVEDANGRSLSLDYDSNHRLIQLNDSSLNRDYGFIYDASGRLITVRDPLQQTTTYHYDANNALTGITDKRGNTATVSYTTPAHHAGTLLPDEIVRNSSTTGFDFNMTSRNTLVTDARDNEWLYTYDTTGNVVNLRDPELKSILLDWDPSGNLMSVTNRHGFIDTFSYDTQGNRLSHTNPLTHTRSWTYEASYCRPITYEDFNGNSWSYVYDGQGNLTQMTDPLLGESNFTYDARGQTDSATNPGMETTTYLYDGNGNITRVDDPAGGQRSYTYDDASRRTEITDGNGNTTTYEYDALNRLTSKEAPQAARNTYDYDANDNLVSITDPRNAVTGFTYDSFDRLTRITDPSGNFETYDYDPMGNRIQSTDRNGNSATSTYDALNRLVATTSPMGHSFTYTYDCEGNPATRTDPLGRTVTRAYDDAGRLTSRTLPGPFVTNYTYDANGNLLQASQPNSTIAMTYDGLDRKLTITDIDLNKTLTLTYDPNGTLRDAIRPDGDTQVHLYDANDRLSRITADGQQFDFSHDPGGRRTQVQRPHATTNYTYDSLNRLTLQNTTDGMDNRSHSFVYGSDTIEETREDTTTNLMTFDLLNRMTRDQASGPVAYDFIYQFDPNGNITDNSGTNPFFPNDPQTFTYNMDNEVVRETGTSFGGAYTRNYIYDDNGNLIQTSGMGLSTVTYQYDPLNRLIGANDSGVGAENYTYDALDRLQSITVPMPVPGELGFQRFFYDQDNNVIINYNMGGSIQEQYWHNRGTVLFDTSGGIDPVRPGIVNQLEDLAIDYHGSAGADDFTVPDTPAWKVDTLISADKGAVYTKWRQGYGRGVNDRLLSLIIKVKEAANSGRKPWKKPVPPGPFIFTGPAWWGRTTVPVMPEFHQYGFPRQPDDYLLRKVGLSLFFLIPDAFGNISGGTAGLLAGITWQLYDLFRRIIVYGSPGPIGAGGSSLYRDRINSVLDTHGRACNNFTTFRFNQPKRNDGFDTFDGGAEFEIDTARSGLPRGAPDITTGSYYLDDFQSFRTLAP